MPLVCATAAELKHKGVWVAGEGIERTLPGWTVPGCTGAPSDIHVTADIFNYAITHPPIEGMPLVCAGGIKFQHKKVIVVAITIPCIERGLTGWTVPGCTAVACDIYVIAAVHGYTVAEASIEGVPLVCTAAAELQHEKFAVIPADAIKRIERALTGWTVPECIAVSRDIYIAGAVRGYAIDIDTRPIEGVPLVCTAAAELQHKKIAETSIKCVERTLACRTIPGCIAPS